MINFISFKLLIDEQEMEFLRLNLYLCGIYFKFYSKVYFL